MLLNEVREYVQKNNMLNDGDRIVVGVSGGADSVCLLKLLCEMKAYYNIELIAVHINHGIRGKEAERDKNFTIGICEEWGVECRVYDYDIPKLASMRGTTEEETGRDVRYETFRSLLKEENYNKIAVAHNMGDNCETILFNLCRGSELKGLGGIEAVRNEIIRPLLNTSRDDIEAYLRENGIKYIVDSTNLSNDYGRNKMRNVIIPYLEENINSKAIEHIVDAGMSALEAYEYLEYQTDNAIKKYNVDEEYGLISAKIMEEPKLIVKRIIRRVLVCQAGRLKDITAVHIKSVMSLFDMEVSKSVNLPYNLKAVRTYEGVRISKNDKKIVSENIDFIPEENVEYGINGKMNLKMTVYSVKTGKKVNEIQEKMYTKCFDYDKIKDTLRIRNRLMGDYFIADKNGSRKKLKDYFINEKVPKEDRDEIVLVADGSHILWVIGYRISEYYKVTDATTRVLQINVDVNKVHSNGGKENGS